VSKTIPYTGKYLEASLIDSLFKKGKVKHIDKTLCGNGFSTSFLTLKPRKGKRNIIIAPNKAVVISKETAYKNGDLPTNNKIKFFYQESDSKEGFEDADILFFVADSFVLMERKLKAVNKHIDKVLLDEYHSTQIQSSFRDNLVNFIDQVKDICSHRTTSIVTVTASPNLYAEVDVRLVPDFVPRVDIIMEYDQSKTIQRIREDLENGENVVVCTNASRNVYLLRDEDNRVRARFIMGTTLSRSLYELIKVEHDEEAPLTIVSARGFEGFDIDYKEAHVYFLEDRSQSYQTFYLSNLYQAISRTRRGAAYIEYCRQDLSYKRPMPFKNIDRAVGKFIKRNSISAENKLKKKYQHYHPFITWSENDRGEFALKKNQAAIDLNHERYLYDYFPDDSAFDEFCKNRNISLITCQGNQDRCTPRVSEAIKIRNLFDNKDAIKKTGVYDDSYRLNPEETIRASTIKPLQHQYLKYLKTFIRRKNYDQEYILSKRQQIALNILDDQKEFKRVLRLLVKTYNERSIRKYGKKASRYYRENFKVSAERRLCRLVLLFTRDFITAPPKWVAHRDYNILTEIGVDEIETIAKYFGVNTLEVDAKSCFLRILYGLCGLELKENLYGENKENKVSLNVALNDVFYRPTASTSKKRQKQNRRRSLERFGINPVVVEYIIDHFFESRFRGDLFTHVSYHEKKLISMIRDLIRDTGRNNGFVRRHDSIMVFDNTTLLDFLNDTKYLTTRGWFNVEKTRSIMYKYQEGVELVEKENFFEKLE